MIQDERQKQRLRKLAADVGHAIQRRHTNRRDRTNGSANATAWLASAETYYYARVIAEADHERAGILAEKVYRTIYTATQELPDVTP